MEKFNINKYLVTDYYFYIWKAQNYLAGLMPNSHIKFTIRQNKSSFKLTNILLPMEITSGTI